MARLILAAESGSLPDREKLAEAFALSGIDDFDIRFCNIAYANGKPVNPKKMVLNRSRLLAESVMGGYSDCFVVGCYSAGWLGGALERPQSREEAYKRLKKLSGSFHQYHSGIHVVNRKLGLTPPISESFEELIGLKKLGDDEIAQYLDSGPKSFSHPLGYNPLDSRLVESVIGNLRILEFGIPVDRIAELVR